MPYITYMSQFWFHSKIAQERLTVPTHIDVTAIRWLDLRSSERAVTTCRAPVAPRGWPKALWLVLLEDFLYINICLT